MKLTERQIERQIVDLLTAHGWRVLRTNVFNGAVIQRQGSIEPGIPDLMARRGAFDTWRIVWIEVKCPGGKLKAKQVAWAAAHPDEEKRIATCIEDVEDLI